MAVTIVGNNTPTAGGVVYGDGTNYASTAAGTSQFDLLYHGGLDAWKAAIQAVKDKYPKPGA
jgi:hypothetical protein